MKRIFKEIGNYVTELSKHSLSRGKLKEDLYSYPED